MNIEQKVLEYLKENNINGSITSVEDVEDGFYNIDVDVDRCDYEKCLCLDYWEYIGKTASIHFHQKTPPLVDAEVGNFVLLFSQHDFSDEKSSVGIVSSKIVVNGKTLYSCRYIRITLGDSFAKSTLYDYSLTTVNYGGYHDGFLKVLTKEETLSHLKNDVKNQHKKAIDEANSRFERTNKKLDNFIEELSNAKIYNTNVLCFDYISSCDMPDDGFAPKP